MGSVEISREETGESVDGFDGIPVYEVEHAPGFEPFSPQHVIQTLVAEIQRLRREQP